jgi:hypothetical protein
MFAGNPDPWRTGLAPRGRGNAAPRAVGPGCLACHERCRQNRPPRRRRARVVFLATSRVINGVVLGSGIGLEVSRERPRLATRSTCPVAQLPTPAWMVRRLVAWLALEAGGAARAGLLRLGGEARRGKPASGFDAGLGLHGALLFRSNRRGCCRGFLSVRLRHRG